MNKQNNSCEKAKEKKIIHNQKWIALFFVFAFVFLVWIYVIFNSSNLFKYFLTSTLFLLFLYGTILVLKKERLIREIRITFIDIDIFYALVGAIATYTLTRTLPISNIISSASIGLIGYVLFKKNSFAIYCGSFVGMTSSDLFNYYQLLLAGVVCGLVFVVVKQILNGYGGRLGTIAFISTAIIALFFNKTSLIVEQNYSILLVFIASILGVTITFLIHNNLKQSVILASVIPSLLIAVIIEIFFKNLMVYSAVFFTASFLGMADNKNISNILSALFAGVVMSIIFLSFFNFFNGFGGKMGMSAFVSLVIYLAIKDIINRVKSTKKTERLEVVF